MSALTNTLENKLIDHLFRGTAYTAEATWIALYTAAPGEAGGGTEVTGGSYARQQVATSGWTTRSDGVTSNNAEIAFPQATADWGTVVAVAILSASSAGNMNWYAALASNKVVSNGDIFKFAIGDLDVSLA